MQIKTNLPVDRLSLSGATRANCFVVEDDAVAVRAWPDWRVTPIPLPLPGPGKSREVSVGCGVE